MENPSSANNNTAECQQTVTIVTLQEFSQILESQPRRWHGGTCQIHRVPPRLRLRRQQQSDHVYDPVMVSLGPYHHGKPELRQAEEFKHLCLDSCAQGSEEKKSFFYNKVLEQIDVIRRCYAEDSIVSKYDDKALALMMLLDACFIINFMEIFIGMKRDNYLDWRNCFGPAATIIFAGRDIFVLENQIPFQILKQLISLQYEREEEEKLLHGFLGTMLTGEQNQARIPREDEDPPLHILEACWRVIVEIDYSEPNQQIDSQPEFLMRRKNKDDIFLPYLSYDNCRSVTDLKAKGIHFRPSFSLKDIRFKSRAFYGQLQLPVQFVSDITTVFYSNMIAFEISPDTKTDLVVLSYTNFMKSLIDTPEDVKELQEKRILFNRLANAEQVVKAFKDIDTFGILDLHDIFNDVKRSLGEHCSSRGKTWMADLIHTQFRSPWTVIALFAATLLLCLTFLQTFFTIHPAK